MCFIIHGALKLQKQINKVEWTIQNDILSPEKVDGINKQIVDPQKVIDALIITLLGPTMTLHSGDFVEMV